MALVLRTVENRPLTWQEGDDNLLYLSNSIVDVSAALPTPGGVDGELQYNDNGTFAGVPDLTYNSGLLQATGSFTGSFVGNLEGTASYATTAENVILGTTSGQFLYDDNGGISSTADLTYTSGLQATGSFQGNLNGIATTASYVELTAGEGILINGLTIAATVASVNGTFPVAGNISTPLVQTVTGTSASFDSSGSGDITASLADGLTWIISGDANPSYNGDVYIYNSGSVGGWFPIAPLDTAAGDARYLMLTPQSPLAGPLNLGSQNLTNGGTITAASFAGTASWAVSASYIQTAETASYVQTAQTASYILNAVSSSIAVTASYAVSAVSSSFATTASYAINTVSSSLALTASSADSFTVRNNVTVLGTTRLSSSLAVSGSILKTNLFQGSNAATIQNLTAGTLSATSDILSGSYANRILPLGYSLYYLRFNESFNDINDLKIETNPTTTDLAYSGPITIAVQNGSNTTRIRANNTTLATVNSNQWVTLLGQGVTWRVVNRGRFGETVVSSGAAGVTQFITGSLTVTSDLTSLAAITLGGLFQGNNTDTRQRVSAGTLVASSDTFPGTSQNRTLPLGYNNYYIFFNENPNNKINLQIGTGLYTGPITINAQPASSLTTIRYNGLDITTISEDQSITLFYDSFAGEWRVINRGKLGDTIVSTGGAGVTQSITGSLIVSGSLRVPTLTTTAQTNVVTFNATTGQLFYTASSALSTTPPSYPVTSSGTSIYTTTPATTGFSATDGIFLGYQAGNNAATADRSNFIGYQAGNEAGGAEYSNFLGYQAGQGAVDADYSNFIGAGAGKDANLAFYANFVGPDAGNAAYNADYSNFIGYQAGYSASSAANSNFIGTTAGKSATNAIHSNFIGESTGQDATNAEYSNFIGDAAGKDATSANNSNFIGRNAGDSATNANNSNFIGTEAGNGATYAYQSVFIGAYAGQQADFAADSNFIGNSAGYGATNASNSNFIGNSAGNSAVSASASNFLGAEAGYNATGASYSTLIGWRTGYANNTALSIGENNIIIGNAVTLAAGRRNAMNLGGVIFATGSYSGGLVNGNGYSGSVADAKVGIATNNPAYTLDVSGSGNFSNGLTVTSSLLAASITGSLQGTATTASYVLQAVSSSFATTASYALTTANVFTNNLTVSGSFITTGSLSVIGTATVTSASVQGTVVTNIGDTFTGTAAVTKIVSLSSAEYSALSPKDSNTLYVVI